MLLHFVGLSNKKSHFPKRGHLVIEEHNIGLQSIFNMRIKITHWRLYTK